MATRFGPYELGELIGRGGMGEVYRAFDTAEQRTVALKLLAPRLATDAAFVARFRREARVAARLRDPHVVPIHRTGEIDGTLYIDMRLVDGTDLGKRLRAGGGLSAAHAVAIIEQVAAALDEAHAEGLVHRDVKPSNVLLTGPEGREFCYLADFGITRSVGGNSATSLTATGAMIGTFAYMAPERFQGRAADHRVDVYALGCLLYECLTGRAPFTGDDMAAMIHQHLNVPAPKPSAAGAPDVLDDVVATAMAKEPDDRHSSAGALAFAARDALDGYPAGPVGTRPAAVTTRLNAAVTAAPRAPATRSVTPPDSPVEPLPALLGLGACLGGGAAVTAVSGSPGGIVLGGVGTLFGGAVFVAEHRRERRALDLRRRLERDGVVFTAEDTGDRWARQATVALNLPVAEVYRRSLTAGRALRRTRVKDEMRMTGTVVLLSGARWIVVRTTELDPDRSSVSVAVTPWRGHSCAVNQLAAYRVIEHIATDPEADASR